MFPPLSKPALWITGALGVVCLVLGAALSIQNARLDAVKGKNVLLQHDLKTATASNKAQSMTITSLEKANRAFQAEAEARSKDLAMAAQQVVHERERATAAYTALRREREKMYASTPDCQALKDLRIDLACPALADSLRRQADGR